VTIRDETEGLLLNGDRFIKGGKVFQELEPALEGGSKIMEISGLVRVVNWGETDSQLL